MTSAGADPMSAGWLFALWAWTARGRALAHESSLWSTIVFAIVVRRVLMAASTTARLFVDSLNL